MIKRSRTATTAHTLSRVDASLVCQYAEDRILEILELYRAPRWAFDELGGLIDRILGGLWREAPEGVRWKQDKNLRKETMLMCPDDELSRRRRREGKRALETLEEYLKAPSCEARACRDGGGQ